MGYGFTQPPRLNGSSSDVRRFGTCCPFDDRRPPRAQLKSLHDRLQADPRALISTVSIHVRGPGRKYNFVRDVLPIYRMIASVVVNSEQQVGEEQKPPEASPQHMTATLPEALAPTAGEE